MPPKAANTPKITANVVLAPTPAAMDGVLQSLEKALSKVDVCQGSRVRLVKAELEMLQLIEQARDFMAAILQDRTLLKEIFADCLRIGKLRATLEATRFSGKNCEDKRPAECMKVVESVEQLIKDNAWAWGGTEQTDEELDRLMQEALAAEKRALCERRTSVRLAGVHEAVKAFKALQIKKVRKKRNDPVPAILACDDPVALRAMEPNKKKHLGWWMIWTVHRFYLNDPELTILDFTNLQMPSAVVHHIDARAKMVAPKLVGAVATNTHVKRMILANANLQGADGRELGEALRQNSTLRGVDVSSNMLAPTDLEVIFRGAGDSTSLEDLQCQEQLTVDAGRSANTALEALLEALRKNTKLFRVGMRISEPHYNNEINKQIMKNRDVVRRKRYLTQEQLDSELRLQLAAEEEERRQMEIMMEEETSSDSEDDGGGDDFVEEIIDDKPRQSVWDFLGVLPPHDPAMVIHEASASESSDDDDAEAPGDQLAETSVQENVAPTSSEIQAEDSKELPNETPAEGSVGTTLAPASSEIQAEDSMELLNETPVEGSVGTTLAPGSSEIQAGDST
eukprot:CAMPEP_0194487986 /NCGR_PEP_ID=MMETSP0253-20130528/8081_1 /TAXON_ID=2966 /ORGANISM="Noctiluca scintillans" /LENGTH=566 /DNA_ID=CAMNT_0039328299 /DNA_START=56 /DNA_END=1756 /DNA_ORIENTATION=+